MSARRNGQSKIVIVADDDASLYRVQEALPALFGCQVIHACGGQEVLKTLEGLSKHNKKASLILTDDRMLKRSNSGHKQHDELMSGMQLTQSLHSGECDRIVKHDGVAYARQLPVVIFTAKQGVNMDNWCGAPVTSYSLCADIEAQTNPLRRYIQAIFDKEDGKEYTLPKLPCIGAAQHGDQDWLSGNNRAMEIARRIEETGTHKRVALSADWIENDGEHMRKLREQEEARGKTQSRTK